MNFGTSRSDDVTVARGADTTAGVVTRAVTTGAGRTAAAVREADVVEDTTDGDEGAERVAADDERLGEVEVRESAGSCDVGADATADPDRAAARLAEPPPPAQPATTVERTAAPARERAAYQRACLTTTHACE